jgi:hypothetical protein
MQVSFILLVTCFIIVCILSLTYPLRICDNFLNIKNGQSWKKSQQQQIFRYGGSISLLLMKNVCVMHILNKKSRPSLYAVIYFFCKKSVVLPLQANMDSIVLQREV